MVRLGRISYVNMAPVFYRLEADVQEEQGVPTELNRRLLAEWDMIGLRQEHLRQHDRGGRLRCHSNGPNLLERPA